MKDRSLLHVNKLEQFKTFLVGKGYQILETKGLFEVLRAKNESAQPLILYKRDRSDHVTLPHTFKKLFFEFKTRNK